MSQDVSAQPWLPEGKGPGGRKMNRTASGGCCTCQDWPWPHLVAVDASVQVWGVNIGCDCFRAAFFSLGFR